MFLEHAEVRSELELEGMSSWLRGCGHRGGAYEGQGCASSGRLSQERTAGFHGIIT
jgi:hypothetical protein